MKSNPTGGIEALEATLFTPGGSHSFLYTPSQRDYENMGIALDQASQAFTAGDSPIGAVLVHTNGDAFPAQTTEFRENKLLGHAEMNAIECARMKYGRNLGHFTLYTTAEPCISCSYLLDKGSVGMVIAAATRDDAPDFFRGRDVTLRRIWSESRRPLTYVRGLRRTEAAALLTADAKRH